LGNVDKSGESRVVKDRSEWLAEKVESQSSADLLRAVVTALGPVHKENDPSNDLDRVTDVDYKLDINLIHAFDVKAFSDQIDDLFKWHTDEEVRRGFMAPFFPLMIQSSGMGKSKLSFESKK